MSVNNKEKIISKQTLKTMVMIVLGCAIYAVGFNLFFQPNNIVMGGFTGLAQIINRLIPVLPVGMLTIVMNIPLFIIGVKKQGLKLLVNSLIAMSLGSLMIDGLAMVVTFQPMEPLLATIYGGVFVGASCGLMLAVGATTGGSDLAARLLRYKLRNLSIGKLCLAIDGAVVILYALVFGSINNSLYGIIAMYICSIVMDMVIYGTANDKLAYIISDYSEEISKKLLSMDLGVTILDGRGAYSGNAKQVLMCVVRRNQITAIKALAAHIDPNAFVIITEAHEVLGEGFGVYDPESI